MPKTKKTKEINQRKFLAAYVIHGTITAASKAAGIDRHTTLDWRNNDPEFAAKFEEAHRQHCDGIEDEIRRRAIEGVDRPVYQGGKKVGTINERSDTLLIFYAKRFIPEYRDRQAIEHSGKLNHDHRVDLHAVRTEMLNDPEYLEFQRQRALVADAHACLVRANGEPRALENGDAPHDPRPGTNGHSNGAH